MSENKLASAETLLFLRELRSRVLLSCIVLLLGFAILLLFANQLYTWLAEPLLALMPGQHLIATQLISPVFVPFKLAFVVALLLATPFFLYQAWSFISPALYGNERKLIWPLIIVSISLFYGGICFAYWLILPTIFHFLVHTAPRGVIFSPDISNYLDFTLNLLLMFGALFEIPIIMLALALAKIISRAQFAKRRGLAIVGAFIMGMLLAPPDVISQTLLALPIWLLYEVGLVLIAGIMRKGKQNDTA